MNFRRAFVVSAVALSACHAAHAQSCGDGTCVGDEPVARIVLGATLGNGTTTGLPARIFPDYIAASPDQLLDQTLPVYVHYLHTNVNHPECFPPVASWSTGTIMRLATPTKLMDFDPWFTHGGTSYASEFKVSYVQISASSSDGATFQVCSPNGPAPTYQACEAPVLELPVVDIQQPGPLDASGNLRVRDRFGGAAGRTVVVLRRVVPHTGSCPAPPLVTLPAIEIVVVLGWGPPGCYDDATVSGTSCTLFHPGYGTTLPIYVPQFAKVRQIDRCDTPELTGIFPMAIVPWASNDFLPTSPGFVDAADLGAMAGHLGSPVSWGICAGCGELPNSNWKFDVNLDGFIDMGDVASLASDMNKHCMTGGSKADADSETHRIMTWFGFASTGSMVSTGQGGEDVPGWALVDRPQMLRAIEDPYGYKVRTEQEQSREWGQVKRLYREVGR